MEIKLEGRQVEIGDELRERISKRLEALDKRFGPITHARVSIEKKAHRNEQRAEAMCVINLSGNTLTATKEASTVVGSVNDLMDTLTENLLEYVEKKKEHR